MNELVHQGHLLKLTRFKAVECDYNDVLDFNLGGTSMHFRDIDFALVTGLKYSLQIINLDRKVGAIKTMNIQTICLNNRAVDKDELEEFFKEATSELIRMQSRWPCFIFLTLAFLDFPQI